MAARTDPRAVLRALAAALAWTVLAGSAVAQGADPADSVSAKSASGGKRAAPSHGHSPSPASSERMPHTSSSR